MGKVYIKEIDALKGIAIFLVVLGHSIIVYPIDLHQNVICNNIYIWLSSFHMPLLFFISGFCFSYRESYKEFIKKKIFRILIPYLFFNAIDIIPRALFPSLVNRDRGIEESIKYIIFYGGEYWFLYDLFIIFLIYPLIAKYTRNTVYRQIIVILTIVLLHFTLPSIHIFNLSKVIYNMLFFSVGILIKEMFGDRIFNIKIDKKITISTMISLLILWRFLIKLNILCRYVDIICALVGIITTFLCIQSEIITTVFARFGKYSLQLYLLNGYLLVISRTIIVTVFKIYSPVIIICFNMMFDFFASYFMIKYLCEKNRVIRTVMGIV